MGQAKRRGSREERIAQSIDRQRTEQLQRERLKAEQADAERARAAAMPEEMQRRAADARRRKVRVRTVMALAMAATLLNREPAPGGANP